MGTVFPFEKFQADFVASEKNQHSKVVSMPWRVQVIDEGKSRVFFFYTYDMFACRENDQGKVVDLFPTGIWRLYSQLYKKNKFETSVLKTFEFKTTF